MANDAGAVIGVRIGVTGHMNLSAETEPLVVEGMSGVLDRYAGHRVTGVSCIARGADSLFDDLVLQRGSRLEVIIPAVDYRSERVRPADRSRFDQLHDAADSVAVLPFATSDRTAYEAANALLLSTIDRLVAVWDGEGATDRGGTASVVMAARRRGLPVDVVWPEGARRQTS